MKINFTKKQFRKLLDLIFAGDYLINGHRLPDETIEDYRDIQQYVYSFAKAFGYEDLVEFDKEFNEYMETRKYDDTGIYDLLTECDDDIFWDKLTEKLAQRDVVNENRETIDTMERDEVVSLLWQREEEYNEEFYENGLDNVRVDMEDK